jgi:hypothetical protein
MLIPRLADPKELQVAQKVRSRWCSLGTEVALPSHSDVIDEWRKLHDEELHTSPSTIAG